MGNKLVNCEKCRFCGEIIDFENWDIRLCEYSKRKIQICNHSICQHFSLKAPKKSDSQKPKQSAVIQPARCYGKTQRFMLIKDMICSMPDPSSITDQQLIRIFDIANKVIDKL